MMDWEEIYEKETGENAYCHSDCSKRDFATDEYVEWLELKLTMINNNHQDLAELCIQGICPQCK
jgi:hypothetical protein